MSRKENIEKNMEFLIKELQKEWDVSKETKHRVTISIKCQDLMYKKYYIKMYN